MLDTYSGSVHELDKLSYDLLDYTDENMSEECPERAISDLKSEGYSEEEIRECYAELYGLYKDEELYAPDSYENFAKMIGPGAHKINVY